MTRGNIPLTPELGVARSQIEAFLSAGPFRLFENDVESAVPHHHAAVEVSFGKLIFACWTEDWSRSWRVVGCEQTRFGLRLTCTKQMGLKSCRLDLSRAGGNVEDYSRAQVGGLLPGLIESKLPGFKVNRIASATLGDDSRTVHHRFVLENRREIAAGIAVSESDSQDAIDATLGAGIVWRSELRKKHSGTGRLMIFVPRKSSATIATRLCAVKDRETILLFEYDVHEHELQPITAFNQGDLVDRLRSTSRRVAWPRPKDLDADTRVVINSVTLLEPNEIEHRVKGNRVIFSIRGLDFARLVIGRKRVEFGVGDFKTILDRTTRGQLRELIENITMRREPDTRQPGDPLFRAQPERWLETTIIKDVTAIDPTLDADHIYSQVPAYRGDQRSYIDLLGVTRRGRLVVIELKVAEDPDFPFQGLDYWTRVEWHRRRGDFYRRGYFKEVRLSDESPLLYLVAPLFRFHASTALITGGIVDEVPVFRIGINEDWRRGVRVLLTERMNPKF